MRKMTYVLTLAIFTVAQIFPSYLLASEPIQNSTTGQYIPVVSYQPGDQSSSSNSIPSA